ncbi:hypothetical protein [Bacteroides thetaiotaomicron]|uniref:hypothetical protein n=1 Tax=Bacteroides thetaiotaomicron TaxID=818 RepID=UPI0039C4E1E3
MENKKNDNSQQMIAEAIRKIALGRSVERINMAPCGTGGDWNGKNGTWICS